MPRGGRRSNPGGRPRSPESRKARAVYLFDREWEAVNDSLEEFELWQDFTREALSQLPRTRKAIAEIEDMIANCREAEERRLGDHNTATTQRRTLEFVLGMLKPPKVKR